MWSEINNVMLNIIMFIWGRHGKSCRNWQRDRASLV